MTTVLNILKGNRTVRKASAALGITLIGGLGLALGDGGLTLPEAGRAVGLALVACAGVWKTANAAE